MRSKKCGKRGRGIEEERERGARGIEGKRKRKRKNPRETERNKENEIEMKRVISERKRTYHNSFR